MKCKRQLRENWYIEPRQWISHWTIESLVMIKSSMHEGWDINYKQKL